MTGKYKKLIAIVLLAAAAAAALLWFLAPRTAGKIGATIARIKQPRTAVGWPVQISTVAGEAARFSDPYGLVMDRAGNLFVADAGDNNRIRKIAPDGSVTTLAGEREGFADGAGAAAAFNTPSGMAIDGDGNLYLADTGNNAIRKITAQGMVSTLAGGGQPGYRDGKGRTAQFNGPIGVALDKAGNVFVADTYNDRIRMIAPNGEVSTVAGSGTPGALDGAAALAGFDTPCALAVDAWGNLFIADTGNSAIRQLSPSGQVTTLVRTEDDAVKPLMRRPVSLALTGDGYLYVGDMARGRILQLAPDGQLHGLTGIGIDIAVGDHTALRLARPTAIAIGPDGALVVADAVRRAVRKLSPRGAATGAPVSAPVAAAVPALGANFPWPVRPQQAWHEVVGTVGEVRGNYDGESRDHFHNGLDVQAAMGEPVVAVAAEKVSSPLPNWAYGGVGEGIALDAFAYIHIRVGRSVKDAPLDPSRFTLLAGVNGKPERVRVKRGTRFAVGDALGTVNRMFHVHLVYQPAGGESNAMALPFAGLSDRIAPRIASITLVDAAGKPLPRKKGRPLVVNAASGPLAIVVDAHDQSDGNAARRRLGIYKMGYQVLRADGTPLPGFEQPLVNIEFNRLPPDQESVKLAYADNSGITVYGSAATRFLYVVTNKVRDGVAEAGGWNPAGLAPGDYTIRIFAADHAGNEAAGGRELPITIE